MRSFIEKCRPGRVCALMLILGCLTVAGCGTKQVTVTGANGQATTETVANIHFANTKFVLHMGLAFGAFHRYIYTPLKDGELHSGAPHRIRTLATAALGAAFMIHELKIAHEDAESSNQLRPLLVKLDNLETRIEGLVPGLKHNAASASQITSSSNAVNTVSSSSSGLGLHITDITHAL